MATPAAIITRRAVLQRDIRNLSDELLALAEVVGPVAPPKSRQAEHQANNEWQVIRDTLQVCIPALREKLEGAQRDG